MPAFAQQATGTTATGNNATGNNVITQSEDAFGRSAGNERIGIYSNDEVRGFNPSEAGNVRVEGLYGELGNINSPRLILNSSIRVGYAARGTPFPAPTGIVDFRIEKFAGELQIAGEFEYESNASVAAALEAKIPIVGKGFGLALGLGFREADQPHGRNGSFRNFLAGASWVPDKEREVTLFSSGFFARSAEAAPTTYPVGSAPPPRQPRKLQQTQPWAINRFNGKAAGLIVRQPLLGMKLEAGLFRTSRIDKIGFVSLQLGTDPAGRVGELVVFADDGNKLVATSGEVRLSKVWSGEKLRHSLIASIRGRQQHREFGGQQRISLGTSRTDAQDFRPSPAFVPGLNNESRVRQYFFGLQYNLLTRSGSILSVAAQKARYRKRTDFASATLPDSATSDSPFLFSVNGALVVSPRLKLYGGFVRGMEDSAIAPDIAVNRSEAPPALRTRQMDAGVRYLITPRLTVIAGVFDIRKPYFGVDAGLRFSNLGSVTIRGVELSVAGALADGVTLVAGGILVDPKIKGTEVDAGRLGQRPVGSFQKRGIFNLDWKPVGQEAWSFDIAFEGKGGETADRLNTFTSPGKFTANLGMRYRFGLAGAKIMLRVQVLNLTNSYGWRVNSAGGFSFSQPRSIFLHLFADF